MWGIWEFEGVGGWGVEAGLQDRDEHLSDVLHASVSPEPIKGTYQRNNIKKNIRKKYPTLTAVEIPEATTLRTALWANRTTYQTTAVDGLLLT